MFSLIRDVTKFEFEFDNVRTSNVFNRFEMNVLSALSNANSWENPCSTTDFIWYAQTARECRQTFFFSNSTYHANWSYLMRSIILAP